jgi:hypothetical protein
MGYDLRHGYDRDEYLQRQEIISSQSCAENKQYNLEKRTEELEKEVERLALAFSKLELEFRAYCRLRPKREK